MELYIESLTGTCFELIVSSYETILSVKTKIQRLEGIPIAQQYLIWQQSHLQDDCCLKDYGITGGCTLKLVLAMRGGPINTRRVGIEDENLNEMANYIESSQEDLFGKLTPPPSCTPGKSKQVTLLVFRDGDQLNFFRVVDRGDGTLTPLSESLSDSTFNPRDEDEEEDDEADDDYQIIRRHYQLQQQQPSFSSTRLNMAKIFENNITATKMKQVRSRMRNFSINEKIPAPPTMEKPDKPVARRKIKGYTNNVTGNRNLSLPSSSTLNDGDEEAFKKPTATNTTSPMPNLYPESDENENSSNLLTSKRSTADDSEVPASKQRQQIVELENEDDDLPNEQDINNAKSPAPGLLFNRHDLYLRTYGLVQSKDEITSPNTMINEDKFRVLPPVVSARSGRLSSNKQRNEENATNNHHQQLSYKTATKSSPVNPPDDTLLPFEQNHRLYSSQYFRMSKTPSRDTVESISPTPSVSTRNHLFPSFQTLKSDDSKLGSSSKMKSSQENQSLQSRLQGGMSSRMLNDPFSLIPDNFDELKRKGKDNDNSFDSMFGNKHSLSRFTKQSFGKNVTETTKLTPLSKNSSNASRTKDYNTTTTAASSSSSSGRGQVEAHRQEAREMVDYINKTVNNRALHKLVCSPVKSNSIPASTTGEYNTRHENSPLSKSRAGSRRALLQRIASGGKQRNAQRLSPVNMLPSPKNSQHKLLPPVKAPSKKKRCCVCGKRTGLATSYICRCGYNFCSVHRYAEAHSCTYDYKSAGRKVLEATNPLVRAPKLPKI